MRVFGVALLSVTRFDFKANVALYYPTQRWLAVGGQNQGT